MKPLNHRMWMIAVLLVFLPCGEPLWARDEVLDVWVPGRSRSHYRDEISSPFVDKLQEVTGLQVRTNSSADPRELEAACADLSADHILVNADEGMRLVEQYGYRLIGYGDTETALYTLGTAHEQLESLRRIGFLRRTGMDEAIVRELPIDGLRERLVEFTSDNAAVSALFAGDVDALIISVHIIGLLTDNLQQQLTLRYPIKTPGRVLILVSPALDAGLRDKLQALYFSDDPLIKRMFVDKAGLTLHMPEDLITGDR